MRTAAIQANRRRVALRGTICVIACVIVSAVLCVPEAESAEQAPWTVKTALKQIDKATKGLRAIRAEVEYIGEAGPSAINGAGTMRINPDGAARFDLPGDEPRTALWLYAYVAVHDPTMNTLTSFNLLTNPQVLSQYALLGFVPRGNALNKNYQVGLAGEEELDGKQVLFFVLTPKSKEVAKAVSVIRLWIDQTTWLPAKQQILLAGSESKLTVRYLTTEPIDELPPEVFQPQIPPGTEKIRY